MRLAWKELRRRPARFVTATAILTLLAVLLMFLGGLLDGLLDGSTGAIDAQRADVVVYSSTSRSSFVRSRIPADIRRTVRGVDGVTQVGGLGLVQLGARVAGQGPRDLADVALFGYELSPVGLPETPPAPGTGWADEFLASKGIHRGSLVRIGPARTPIRIVGTVTGTMFSGQGSVWTSLATWRSVQSANRPDQQLGPAAVQALVVRGGEVDASTLARRIDAATAGATDSLTKAEAIEALPGVKEQRGVFGQIIGVTVAIAAVVVALFFALLTVERAPLYGVLKALGARSRSLFAGVVVQAATVGIAAGLIGAAFAVLLDVVIPQGSIPYSLSAGRLLTSVVYLLVAAVVGCAFSLRRVLRIDPASAIGSGT